MGKQKVQIDVQRDNLGNFIPVVAEPGAVGDGALIGGQRAVVLPPIEQPKIVSAGHDKAFDPAPTDKTAEVRTMPITRIETR
jgi:hypothetical protein